MPANPSTPDQAALKACPFCDDTMFLTCSVTIASPIVRWWQVECGCGASAGCEATEAEAIAAWNTRAPTNTSQDRIAQARETISKIFMQSECLDKYAESHGYEAKPVPSVFHLQSAHFRAYANELEAALAPINALPAVDKCSFCGDTGICGYDDNPQFCGECPHGSSALAGYRAALNALPVEDKGEQK